MEKKSVFQKLLLKGDVSKGTVDILGTTLTLFWQQLDEKIDSTLMSYGKDEATVRKTKNEEMAGLCSNVTTSTFQYRTKRRVNRRKIFTCGTTSWLEVMFSLPI